MSRIDVVRAVVQMDERVEKLSRAVRLMAQYVALHTDSKDAERQALFEQIMNDGECQEQIRTAWTYRREDERHDYILKMEHALARVAQAVAHPNQPSPATKEDWELVEQVSLKHLDLIPGPAPAKPAPLRITEPWVTPPF